MSSLIETKFKIEGETEGSATIEFTSNETSNHNQKKKQIVCNVEISEVDPFIENIISTYGYGNGNSDATISSAVEWCRGLECSIYSWGVSNQDWNNVNDSGNVILHTSLVKSSTTLQDIIDNIGQWEVNYIS